MYTAQKVVEVLDPLGVTHDQINQWEKGYEISIPTDPDGTKLYNDDHIKIFKSIKKYLTLGYNVYEIKRKLNVVRNTPVKPVKTLQPRDIKLPLAQNPMKPKSVNVKPSSSGQVDNLPLIKLIERLMDEKNQLMAEKNNLSEQIHLLELQESELTKASLDYNDEISRLNLQVEILEEQLKTYIAEIPAQKFMGSWNGRAKLLKVVFDTLDIDIPKERNKSFRVTEPPKRMYGNMAVFVSSFKCEEDPLWERMETYSVAYLNNDELKGELDVEYFVDNVAVAKVIYSIYCNRKIEL